MDRAEWIELFEERAAMMEYHGGMSRPAAEQHARALLGPPPGRTPTRRGDRERAALMAPGGNSH